MNQSLRCLKFAGFSGPPFFTRRRLVVVFLTESESESSSEADADERAYVGCSGRASASWGESGVGERVKGTEERVWS